MTATPFLALAGVSLAAHLRAEYGGPKWQVYLCKPLTTVLLFLAAVVPPRLTDGRYTAGIACGLLASLAGDIFLMLPGDQFLAGLLCFLVAHLAYLLAFTAGVPFGQSPWLLLPLGAAAVGLLVLLWPGLGRMKGPVVVYSAVILVMVWQAGARALALPSEGATLAAAGAVLFMASDSLLALNRFRGKWSLAQAQVMVTYVAAQALIALSVSIR